MTSARLPQQASAKSIVLKFIINCKKKMTILVIIFCDASACYS